MSSPFYSVILPLLWSVPLVWAASLLFRLSQRQSLQRLAAAGVGWQAIWAIAAAPVQLGWLSTFGSNMYAISGWIDRLVMLYWPWPVHIGGASVRVIFEATAKQVTGHREFTLIDNLHYFLLLVLIQAAVLAVLFAVRYRQRGSLRDPVILLIGLFVILNAMTNITWPWWGG